MSAVAQAPVETPTVDPDATLEERVANCERMLLDIHTLITRLRPSIEKVSADISKGGLMGLMGGMMGGGR